MRETAYILTIDDDKFVQKVVARALKPGGYAISVASDGEEGIKKAIELNPSIILLDVEMPGLNGYEVCTRLRELPAMQEVAIVFLSSHGSLRERLQGYEVGADDYMVKPFEAEHLLARVNVLRRYQEERAELKAQFQLARDTALDSMTGTSELAMVMQFSQRCIGYTTLDETINGVLDTIEKLGLDSCICVEAQPVDLWFASGGAISPLEKELVQNGEQDKRFMDFGCRTVVYFSTLRLLIRNMPIENMERYGRIKDMLPVLLSAANTKIKTLHAHNALLAQSQSLKQSFGGIRKNLFELASSLVEHRERSQNHMNIAVDSINLELMKVDLEASQEAYILEKVEALMQSTMAEMDMGQELKKTFSFILERLDGTMSKHGELIEAFIEAQTSNEVDEVSDNDDNIELF